MGFIEIAPPTFDVDLDIRYATAANLSGRPIYTSPLCFLHPDAAEKLRTAIALAVTLGVRLRLFDGYRPPEAQWRLWTSLPDDRYIADPRRGSAHARGIAIDLTLSAPDGAELDCGTGFDDMSSLSHHGQANLRPEALRNRTLLAGIMAGAGWERYPFEWWHYQLPGADRFPFFADGTVAPRLVAS